MIATMKIYTTALLLMTLVATSAADKNLRGSRSLFYSAFTFYDTCTICRLGSVLANPTQTVGSGGDMTCELAQMGGALNMLTSELCDAAHQVCDCVPTGTRSWPGLLDMDGDEAVRIIADETADQNFEIIIVSDEDTYSAADYNLERVRIFVDENGKVARVPMVG